MKKYLTILISAFIVLIGCTPEVETVQFIRNPLLKFTYDSITWKADKYSFMQPVRVVVYPADPTQPGALYNRFTLQANGRDEKGNLLQLNIAFDATDSANLKGTYKRTYTTEKGLAEVQLYNLTDATHLTSFHLCMTDTSSSFLQIEKQSQTERLISGNFHMILCNERDSTNKIFIKNGTITDIRY